MTPEACRHNYWTQQHTDSHSPRVQRQLTDLFTGSGGHPRALWGASSRPDLAHQQWRERGVYVASAFAASGTVGRLAVGLGCVRRNGL